MQAGISSLSLFLQSSEPCGEDGHIYAQLVRMMGIWWGYAGLWEKMMQNWEVGKTSQRRQNPAEI